MSMKKTLIKSSGMIFAGIFTYIGWGVVTRFSSVLLIASVMYSPFTTLFVALGLICAAGVLLANNPTSLVGIAVQLFFSLGAAVKNVFTVAQNVGDKIAQTLIDRIHVYGSDVVSSMRNIANEYYQKVRNIKQGDVTVKNMLRLLQSGIVKTAGLCGAGVASYLAVNLGMMVVPFFVSLMTFNYPLRVVTAIAYVRAVVYMANSPVDASKLGSDMIEQTAVLAGKSMAKCAAFGMQYGQDIALNVIDSSSKSINYVYDSSVAKGNETYAKTANACTVYVESVKNYVASNLGMGV